MELLFFNDKEIITRHTAEELACHPIFAVHYQKLIGITQTGAKIFEQEKRSKALLGKALENVTNALIVLSQSIFFDIILGSFNGWSKVLEIAIKYEETALYFFQYNDWIYKCLQVKNRERGDILQKINDMVLTWPKLKPFASRHHNLMSALSKDPSAVSFDAQP